MSNGPLQGIKVLEIAGLAPAPYAGMILADFGAEVVRIDRVEKDGDVRMTSDTLSRGKKSLGLNLKSESGKQVLRRLVEKADVLIEPFRPGVMERLGLGPDVVCGWNPRLIYGRMTGFGQGGVEKVEKAAGHDINYLAVSGILSALARQGERPNPPINLLGDFAGGGLMLALGILLAIIERTRSGKGQVIDAAMVDGASYVAAFVHKANGLGQFKNELNEVGTNLLDGGPHFYGVYTCKDGKHMSVGAIEPQFYALLLKGLGLDPKRDNLPGQGDRKQWGMMKAKFTEIFATKTRDEWAAIFDGTDACCFPILNFEEAKQYEHNKRRGTFIPGGDMPDVLEPRPAPVLSRTPGLAARPMAVAGNDTEQVLRDYGFKESEIAQYIKDKAVGPSKL